MINENKEIKRGRPAKLPGVAEFVEVYDQYSNKELAKLYGVKVSAVQKMARKVDVRKSDTGRPGSAPDEAELKELCIHHTDKEIAEMHNVCPGTVAYWRKKAGIKKYKNS